MATTEDDNNDDKGGRGKGRAPGGAKVETIKAQDLSQDVTPESLLADLGWTGTVDDYLTMLLVAEGEIPGLERFRTTAHQQIVIHINGYEGEQHGELQCKLFDASAEINAKWKRSTGRSLITVSGS